MSEKIEPALTPEDVEDFARLGEADLCERAAFAGEWHKVIAAANHALPDSDPRKITREKIKAIRAGAVSVDYMNLHREGMPEGFGLFATNLRDLADALASYLPPET